MMTPFCQIELHISLAVLMIIFFSRKDIDQLYAKQKHFRFDFTSPSILF